MKKLKLKLKILNVTNPLVKLLRAISPKSMLLIRLDAIGDYVMFRNFIEELSKSKKYKDYKITLLGNMAWKSLALEFDNEFVDSFIWLDRNRFNKDLIYRYDKLKEITSLGYEVVLSPVYSREFFIGDNIVKLIAAKKKIGSIGDLSNINEPQKEISDTYYTKLVDAKNEIMFEFYRNKEFFENLLEVKLNIDKPHIFLKSKKLEFELPKKYAILFIGGSASFRKWNIENFAKVGKYLKDKYDYEIVLCGAPSDSEDAIEFAKYFKDDYMDLVGKTSLVDLLYVISSGSLMIANETSAPHFAVALDKANIFVIYNGNHYGRFTPYPKEISNNYHVVYHPQIEKNMDDYKKLSNNLGFDSNLDIDDIGSEQVILKVDKVLMW